MLLFIYSRKNGYKMYPKRRLIDLGLKSEKKNGRIPDWITKQKRNRRCRKTCRLQKYLACLAFKTPCACPSFFGCPFDKKKIDPDGVQDRSARRLTRRNYLSPGPNFCWHVDGKQFTSKWWILYQKSNKFSSYFILFRLLVE